MKSLFVLLWAPWRTLERRYLSVGPEEAPSYVVLGFPRSGTSLLCTMLARVGVSFGDPTSFRPADWRNPDGFYEHVETNRIDTALLRESRSTSRLIFSPESGVRAKGLFMQLRRAYTRMRMMRMLYRIRTYSSRPWAIKLFPTPFYVWKEYVPRARIVAVFRDPVSSAHSMSTSFGRLSFARYVDEWTIAHEELLYHVSTRPSLLLSLNDLVDVSTQREALTTLASFVGADVAQLQAVLDEAAPKKSEKPDLLRLRAQYPLPVRTQEVYAALQKISRERMVRS